MPATRSTRVSVATPPAMRKKAQGCWAGTRLDDVRLDFHVARVAAKTLDGHPTQIPLAYATHTMSSWKPTVKTYKGTIGNQDAFYCSKPPTTKLTLTAANCTGCQVGVMNGALRVENTWSAEPKTMNNGQVTFRVPRNLTRGITTTVYGPWEGNTGYTALVAWRYAGAERRRRRLVQDRPRGRTTARPAGAGRTRSR